MSDTVLVCETQTKKTEAKRPIDVHIGRKISERRMELAICCKSLGKKVESSSSTIQAYESGKSSVSPVELFRLAEALQVAMSFFYAEEDA